MAAGIQSTPQGRIYLVNPRPAAKADSPIARPPRSSAPAGPRTGLASPFRLWVYPGGEGISPGSALRPRRGRGRVKELKDADVPDAGRLLLGIRVSQRPDPAVMQCLSVK